MALVGYEYRICKLNSGLLQLRSVAIKDGKIIGSSAPDVVGRKIREFADEIADMLCALNRHMIDESDFEKCPDGNWKAKRALRASDWKTKTPA